MLDTNCINFAHCGNTMASQGVVEDDIQLCHHCYNNHFGEFKDVILPELWKMVDRGNDSIPC